MMEAATRSRCVVAIISGPYEGDETAYFNREYCRKEISWAIEAGRFVQPVGDAEDRVKDLLRLVPEDLSHLNLKDVTWERLDCLDKGKFELVVDRIIAAANGHARRQLAATYPPGPQGLGDPLLGPRMADTPGGDLTRNNSIKSMLEDQSR